MSMLTGQSDKLRKAALIQEEHVHYNMALADDTILSLRYRVRELRAENAKLRELCSELLRMAESNDPDFLHWPEIHDELRKVGVEIVQL